MKNITKTLIFISLLVLFSISSVFLVKAENVSQKYKIEEKKSYSEKEQKSKNKQNRYPIKRGEKIPDNLLKARKELKHLNVESTKLKKKHFIRHKHKPYKKIGVHKSHYRRPKYYHYLIPARYIYRGLWIRVYINFDNGYCFYNGYPYFVYNNYLHRYSDIDPGSYDLVDSYTDEVYATFYGRSIKISYDRCAELRDMLNYEIGEYRYFCAERLDYDPDYSYDWDSNDYPYWLWR